MKLEDLTISYVLVINHIISQIYINKCSNIAELKAIMRNSTIALNFDEAEHRCRLFSCWFAFFIQGCLGFMCILTLVIKRQTEYPRRDWDIWGLDALKQGIGSSFGHFTNIFLSQYIAGGSIVTGDECEWYCLSYLMDSSLGIVFNLSMLSILERYIHSKASSYKFLTFGEYGNPPSLRYFVPQLSLWLCIIVMGKLFIIALQVFLSDSLNKLMNFCLSWLQNNPKLELTMVMVIVPVVVNAVQFWLTDSFLKRQSPADVPLIVADKSAGEFPFDHRHMPLAQVEADVDFDEQLLTHHGAHYDIDMVSSMDSNRLGLDMAAASVGEIPVAFGAFGSRTFGSPSITFRAHGTGTGGKGRSHSDDSDQDSNSVLL